MSRKSNRRKQSRRKPDSVAAVPDAGAQLAAHASIVGANIQAAATRRSGRLTAWVAALVGVLTVGGSVLVARSSDTTASSSRPPTARPPAATQQDDLLRDAKQAAVLANIESDLAGTYAMDCSSGDHRTRAKCQNLKA